MNDLKVSFEFFPPKTEKMQSQLWGAVEKLSPLGPDFVSVTYGAGGSTRERTHDTLVQILKDTDVPVAAHLTCVASTKDEVDDVLRSYWDAGVRHIVALRGDPPGGIGEAYVPHPGGYANAAELAGAPKPFTILRFPLVVILKSILNQRLSMTILRCLNAKSTMAPLAASRSSFMITRCISVIWTGLWRPVSKYRLFQALCR